MGLCCVKQRSELEDTIQRALARRPHSTKLRNHAALATFGGGRFWFLEAAFQQVNGVYQVIPGYMGGSEIESPTYENVMSGKSNFAQVVQITYDENIVHYPELVHFFMRLHDPTQTNRQDADIGHQFRSIIFYYDEQQERTATLIKIELDYRHKFDNPIVTIIAPAMDFYPAETEHVDYYTKHIHESYCRDIIQPKLYKFRSQWRKNMKPEETEEMKFVQEVTQKLVDAQKTMKKKKYSKSRETMTSIYSYAN